LSHYCNDAEGEFGHLKWVKCEVGSWQERSNPYAYVAVHRDGKDASGNEDNGLLDMVHEEHQRRLVARLRVHPVGLENLVGQILGIVNQHVAGVAEGEGLQQDCDDEQERGHALPEVREEEHVHQGQTQNGTNQRKLHEDGAGYHGANHVTASERYG